MTKPDAIAWHYIAQHGEFHHELPARDLTHDDLTRLEPGQLRVLAESPFYTQTRPGKSVPAIVQKQDEPSE